MKILLGIGMLLLAGIAYVSFFEVPREGYMSDCPASVEFTSDRKITSFDEVKFKRRNYPGHPGVHYQLSITGDGSVTFERAKGHPFKQTAQLTPEQNAEIVQAINDAAFFSIPTVAYEIDACSGMGDVSISVTAEGESHRVRHLCCAPPRQLISLENSIDRIVNTEQWTKQRISFEQLR